MSIFRVFVEFLTSSMQNRSFVIITCDVISNKLLPNLKNAASVFPISKYAEYLSDVTLMMEEYGNCFGR